ncbi:MAG TPA: ROK family protein, partial [Gammaproteobacteria bacterium]|nr:ROK family protein [Gammaproteobacteria bacterium]
MRIGIDLGGTKIELQALNQQGQTLFRQRVATPQGDYRGTL